MVQVLYCTVLYCTVLYCSIHPNAVIGIHFMLLGLVAQAGVLCVAAWRGEDMMVLVHGVTRLDIKAVMHILLTGR
jgi:hypothetical protein